MPTTFTAIWWRRFVLFNSYAVLGDTGFDFRPANAALFAAKVFGLFDANAKNSVVAEQQKFSREQVLNADKRLNP